MLPGSCQESPHRYSAHLSVPGPKRAKSEDNQDASDSWRNEDLGVHVIAVADGHGSALHEKSAIGSRFAVKCVIEQIKAFLNSDSSVVTDESRFDEFKDWWTETLFQEFHKAWRIKVVEDLTEHRKDGVPWFGTLESAGGRSMDDMRVQYGTTLLVALSCGNLVAFGQVGDGLVIVAGKEIRFPLNPSDNDLDDTRNETDSLCNENPQANFKAFKSQLPPRLVFLCSDGVDDGFDSIASVKQWIASLSGSNEIEKWDDSENSLHEGLKQISKTSGDDATVGLIFSADGEQLDLESDGNAHGSDSSSLGEDDGACSFNHQDSTKEPEPKQSSDDGAVPSGNRDKQTREKN